MADGNARTAIAQEVEAAGLTAFLAELTHLSRAHGIAISGNPELVLMDPEDAALSYKADADSRLSLD